MSDAAPHATPRNEWQAQLRAGIAAGDAVIRSFDPAQARAGRKDKAAPHPNPLPQAGEGVRRASGEAATSRRPLAGEGGERTEPGEGQSKSSGGGGAPRFAKDQLKAFVERIERLQEEKKALSDDIADVYAEVKANGFDKKALRTVIRLRAQDINERKEQEAIVETYLHALGML